MKRERAICLAIRRRLMARASILTLRVALRPRGWASGLLMVGLTGAPAAALAQETVLTTEAELTIQGAAAYDSAGKSVSGAGDVNGDGIDDLLIGAFGASPKDRVHAGASYVVFGAADGLPRKIDLAIDADLVIQGAAAGDYAGNSVSGPGDVNGDGIDDLVIGAYHASPNGRVDAGAAYVVFGAEGVSGTIDLAASYKRKVLVIQGAAAGDSAGSSVSGAGDVNGDGIDDLIIGAPGASPKGRIGAGASYVVFGNADGFPKIIDLASDADLIIQGAQSGDVSGFSVSGAGDLDGDGIDDLVIAAATAFPNGRAGAGGSYVVFGAVDLAGTVDLADPVNGADLIIQGASPDDPSGPVSGAGDVNGDGIDDLLIGSRISNATVGAAYVVFGKADGLPPTIDLATEADVLIRGTSRSYLYFGGTVSGAGDVNDDGIDDLFIGAPFPAPDVLGMGFVMPGATDLAGTIDVADPVTGASLIIDRAFFSLFLDIVVSGAGDVNGDGIDDLVVGAGAASPRKRLFAGASFVVFGGPAAALERLIAAVEAADLPRGLEDRLTRNLENVFNDVTDNKLSRAVLRLRGFAHKVAAQRGATIDETVADDWIADARSIRGTLKAQRERDRAPRPRTSSATATAP